jgi:hypothetical protein
MPTIVLRLDPQLLENPDTDLRYRLPDLLTERSGGLISDDGYDYVGEKPFLVLFLKTSDLEPALACVLEVVQKVRVLDNELRSTVVAVRGTSGYEVVYPTKFSGPFLPKEPSR